MLAVWRGLSSQKVFESRPPFRECAPSWNSMFAVVVPYSSIYSFVDKSLQMALGLGRILYVRFQIIFSVSRKLCFRNTSKYPQKSVLSAISHLGTIHARVDSRAALCKDTLLQSHHAWFRRIVELQDQKLLVVWWLTARSTSCSALRAAQQSLIMSQSR